MCRYPETYDFVIRPSYTLKNLPWPCDSLKLHSLKSVKIQMSLDICSFGLCHKIKSTFFLFFSAWVLIYAYTSLNIEHAMTKPHGAVWMPYSVI